MLSYNVQCDNIAETVAKNVIELLMDMARE
jgi:hypothetical protein